MLRFEFKPNRESIDGTRSVTLEFPDVDGQETISEFKAMFSALLIALTYDQKLVDRFFSPDDGDCDGE